jgi:hypothetical protein
MMLPMITASRLLFLATVGWAIFESAAAPMSAHTAPLAASTAPTTNPSNATGGTFTYKPAAVTFNWPQGWSTTQIEDYQWSIVPADDKSAYLDDLKKQFGNLDIKELSPPKIPNAKDRLVRAAWQKDGKSMEQTALLIVHADHVYIFRGRSDTDHEQPTTDAFNSVTASIQWTK